jgi:hypothetical protein
MVALFRLSEWPRSASGRQRRQSLHFNGPMHHVHSTLGYKLPAQFLHDWIATQQERQTAA